jgi:cell division protein ZapA
MSQEKRTEISICGQVFRLRCAEGEAPQLRAVAQLVEDKIEELRRTGGLVDSHRLALMAAFHFAFEQESRQGQSYKRSAEYRQIQKRLRNLVDEIDSNFGS